MGDPPGADEPVVIDERRLLDTLGRLESLWLDARASIATSLAEGLSPDEIDSIAGKSGLFIPDGLKKWWGWHNGTDPNATDPGRRETGVGLDLLSLEESLALREELLSDFKVSPAPEELPEWYWRPNWLPFAGRWNGALFVDTSERSTGTHVRMLDAMWEDVHLVRAWTLTEVAEAWSHLLERGWAYWVPDAHAWGIRPDLPLYLRRSGLI